MNYKGNNVEGGGEGLKAQFLCNCLLFCLFFFHRERKKIWRNSKDSEQNYFSNFVFYSPEYGPWEGGTNITIQGVNLGKSFEDIARGVTVAGMACDPYQDLYERTEKIVCKVNIKNIFFNCFLVLKLIFCFWKFYFFEKFILEEKRLMLQLWNLLTLQISNLMV